MKKIGLLLLVGILAVSCHAQEQKKQALTETNKSGKDMESPHGTWKVDKDFDENGNLIRYDSIYSWSSGADRAHLGKLDRDSLLKSFQSGFSRNFPGMDQQQFQDLFAHDSLLAKQFYDDDFFNSDFGKDFMDIDRLRQRLEERQNEFLQRYQSESAQPEKGDTKDSNPQ